MKALVCTRCMDIRALPNTPPLDEWITCRCGNASARWTDPETGRVEVRAESRDKVCMLGLHNHMLILLQGGLGRAVTHETFRTLHEGCTDAPNHIFDKSRAGCWAVPFRVGDTSDVRWAEAAA